jgi:hypothetical protein
MIGIVSYGGYIPRLRLDRMSIYQQIGWLAPAVVMVAQGERSMCNWDEDSLTMAVAAARDCLRGLDKKQVNALYLASTTLPFADRLNAGIVGHGPQPARGHRTADFTSTQKAGTTACSPPWRRATANGCWSPPPTGARPRPGRSTRCGLATAPPRSCSGPGRDRRVPGRPFGLVRLCQPLSRGRPAFDYTWEERWMRDEGYAKIIPQAVNGCSDKLGMAADDVDTAHLPLLYQARARQHRPHAGRAGRARWPTTCTRSAARPARPTPWSCWSTPWRTPNRASVSSSPDLARAATPSASRSPTIQACPPGRDQGRSRRRNRPQKLRQVPQVPRPDRDRDGHPRRGARPDRAHHPVAQPQDDPGPGGRPLHGLRHTPISPRRKSASTPTAPRSHTQEEYEFADLPAVVKSYTGDMLAVLDRPARHLWHDPV